jgi:predicted unusual protein kinase regulating ubiquinone biosynthesis (AarF/ABC1/UbiB family)
MVMERMLQRANSQVGRLREAGVDLKRWPGRRDRCIFTRCFATASPRRQCTPATIQVMRRAGDLRRYIALDFGISRTLTDKIATMSHRYFLPSSAATTSGRRAARRKRSGPAATRIDALDRAAVRNGLRTACSIAPIEGTSRSASAVAPFQTSRRYQLSRPAAARSCSETLLNIEGLGRELDPELDL